MDGWMDGWTDGCTKYIRERGSVGMDVKEGMNDYKGIPDTHTRRTCRQARTNGSQTERIEGGREGGREGEGLRQADT